MSIEQAEQKQRERVEALRVRLGDLPSDHPRLTLEIGCGHGHFLTAYSAEHPADHCVAIDIIRERLERAGRKTERAGIRNVSWVLAEAEEFLAALPDGFRINHRIFILFPDPWPKRRHWKNRLIQPGFLDRLAACAAPGTRLCFRTDHAPYFAAAVAMLKAHEAWSVQSPDQWPFEQRTVFEARAAMFESIVADRVRDWEPTKLTRE